MYKKYNLCSLCKGTVFFYDLSLAISNNLNKNAMPSIPRTASSEG